MRIDHLEALLQKGKLDQARAVANLLLNSDLPAGEMGRVRRLAGRACLLAGDYYGGVKLLERAIEAAAEAGDAATEGRAHFEVAVGYIHIGDNVAAQQHLMTVAPMVATMPDLADLEGKIHYNLSITHRQRYQWDRAIQELETAGAIFEVRGDAGERAQVSVDLAWCHSMTRNPGAARVHLDELETHLATNPSDTLAVDLLCGRALCSQIEGDIATSTQLCQEVLVVGRPGATDHHVGEAAWIMGTNALIVGRSEEAGILSQIALDRAAKDNWPTLMNLALDLRRQIELQASAGA